MVFIRARIDITCINNLSILSKKKKEEEPIHEQPYRYSSPKQIS